MLDAQERLDSWKEIAAHFKRDVTTVRRWERREGMPVHRHRHGVRSSVYAHRKELDDWWAGRPAESGEFVPTATAPASIRRHPPDPIGRRYSKARAIAVVGAVLLLVGALAVMVRLALRPSLHEAIRTVAVLPFTSGSSADEAYLSAGLTDAVIDGVSPLPGLRVIARSSVMRYSSPPADLPTVGRELGVQTLVIGSTSFDGHQIAVSLDLVHAESGRRLWSARYAGDALQLLSLQRMILNDLGTALGRGAVAPGGRQPTSVEAYWTYLQARRAWNRRTPESLREAVRLFGRAADIDSTFALAFAGLADAESLIGYYKVAPLQESLVRAEVAARHALDLNERLAEAHAALGQVHAVRWEWAEADREYRRAVALNPNYATVRHWYSNYLSIVGEDDKAIEEARLAVSIDPLSPIVHSGALGNALLRAGRYDEALAAFERALDLDPAFGNARLGRASAYARKRMRTEALGEAALVTGLRPAWNAAALAISAGFDAAPDARRLLQTLEQNSDMSAVAIARVYAAMGERENAVRHLQRAFAQRDPDLAPVVREPWFELLRGDRRVAALVTGLGLPTRQ